MNTTKVVEDLKRQYPGKNIIINDSKNPTEVICEIEPGSINPDRSVAIAVLDNSIKHLHRQSTEEYEVLRGNLEITKGGKTHYLHEGEKMTIEPGELHMAKGNETWVRVTSIPGWTPEDHIISESDK